MVLDKKNLNSLVVLLSFSGNTEVPDAMEMIFQSALALGRKGAVSVLILVYPGVFVELNSNINKVTFIIKL